MFTNQVLRFSFLLTIVLLITALFTACDSKYQDGPLISFTSKQERVSNNWGPVSYTHLTLPTTPYV